MIVMARGKDYKMITVIFMVDLPCSNEWAW